MPHIFRVLTFFLVGASCFASDNAYHYVVNLNDVKDDKLLVTLTPPTLEDGEVLFQLPAIVPGTYAIYNFGRFISDFAVTDNAGKNVVVEHTDVNTWKIPHGNSIKKITYRVEDTWDTNSKDAFVFEPAGTNIQKDTNFVINTHGLFGYFKGYKYNSFQLEFIKPPKFYGSTAMVADSTTTTSETYTASNYMRLVDSPIMFCIPDTTSFYVGAAKILVSVYSAHAKSNSKEIATNLEATLNAQKDYLGGKLPIDKYAFVIYLFSGVAGGSGSFGALEHSYSSMYYMPDMEAKVLGQTVRDMAAHEFFHIITPLSIHSKEIGDFDYNVPKMSQHLWMYEGVTEYFAGHVQVKSGLMKFEDYLNVIEQKIEGREKYYDTLPFTVMSAGCLDKYKNQYENVYQKGALIGMCLDIKMRALSGGSYGLQNLMRDLSKTYGKDKSFSDEELFGEIERLTFPEIGDFLRKYVSGNNPLPLTEILNMVGVDYREYWKAHGISPLGGIEPEYDLAKNHFLITSESYAQINDFGKTIGLNIGDEIIRFQGKKLNIKSAEKIFAEYFANVKEGSKLSFVVLRKDDKGNTHKVKLKVRVHETDFMVKNVLRANKNPDEQQLTLRKAWLGNQ